MFKVIIMFGKMWLINNDNLILCNKQYRCTEQDTHKQYEISIWEDKYSIITPNALFASKTSNMLLIFYHVSLKGKPEFLRSRTRRRSIR